MFIYLGDEFSAKQFWSKTRAQELYFPFPIAQSITHKFCRWDPCGHPSVLAWFETGLRLNKSKGDSTDCKGVCFSGHQNRRLLPPPRQAGWHERQLLSSFWQFSPLPSPQLPQRIIPLMSQKLCLGGSAVCLLQQGNSAVSGFSGVSSP